MFFFDVLNLLTEFAQSQGEVLGRRVLGAERRGDECGEGDDEGHKSESPG